MIDNEMIRNGLKVIQLCMSAQGATAEMFNALHACTPGHPFNKPENKPFSNLLFMISGKISIPHEVRDWLEIMRTSEWDGLPSPKGND